MNERLTTLKNRVRAGEHHALRQAVSIDVLTECKTRQLSWPKRVALLVRRQCEAEQVIIESDERIVFTRTLPGIAPLFSGRMGSIIRRSNFAQLDQSAIFVLIGACYYHRGC
jgi:hypothetical protein